MKIIKSLLGIGFGLFLSYSVISSEYIDIPGFGGKNLGTGRTKNSISAIVAGIASKEIYGNSEINLKVKKHFWPDAELTGYTTENSVDTKTDVLLTSARFKAETDTEDLLNGEVDKSEFDWKVKQTGPNTYKIARWGPKFDATLELKIEEGGIIKGTYNRPGPHFDWGIKGTYDKEGNVNIEIDGPLNLGIVLEGKVIKR
ncbi:MAG: hypothetical protein Q8O03_04190 [Nanoarchaeota archaeon]|nr:hypothetical protein [Nanoarchaeota archaeon]